MAVDTISDAINAESRSDEDASTMMSVSFDGVSKSTLEQVTPREVILGESLLTPGLQTSIIFDSYIHNYPPKDFSELKNKSVSISISKPSLYNYGLPTDLEVVQTVYRMDNRSLVNNNNERFTIRACDQTQLDDPKSLVSHSWKCTSPSEVVSYVLSNCLGAASMKIEASDYPRDYIAENIHPFQIVQQQTNYACAAGSDPSFLHYMTYENYGTHNFRSLYGLTRQGSIMDYQFNETGSVFAQPFSILRYSFPCDFDILSDALNGIDEYGNNINSVILLNPADKTFSFFNQDFDPLGCGIGSGVMKVAISNQNTAERQDMCPDYSQYFLQNRQARMGLISKDKITLRMMVPFNPKLNVGKIVNVILPNKEAAPNVELNFGSGEYLILHMFHHIINGGMATTTMDLVAKTSGLKGSPF